MGFVDFVLSQLARTSSRVLEIRLRRTADALALAASGHEVTAIDPVAPEGPNFERVTLEEFCSSLLPSTRLVASPLAPPRAGSRARGGQDRATASSSMILPGTGSTSEQAPLVPRPVGRTVETTDNSVCATGTSNTTVCTATRRCGQSSIVASRELPVASRPYLVRTQAAPRPRSRTGNGRRGPSTPSASATSVHDSRGRRLASTNRPLAVQVDRGVAMSKRTLGGSQLEVSAVGSRCMGMSQSYPPFPDRDEMIGRTLPWSNAGLSVPHTAQVYGPFTERRPRWRARSSLSRSSRDRDGSSASTWNTGGRPPRAGRK